MLRMRIALPRYTRSTRTFIHGHLTTALFFLLLFLLLDDCRWAHERSDIPDVWIDPRDSITFEIKAYEITACRPNKFSAG